MNFKKGDLVVGKDRTSENYNYAGEFCTMEVVEVDTDDGTVLCEIISHEIDSDYIGESEWVDGDDLQLKDGYYSSSSSTNSSNSQSLSSLPGTKIEYNGSKIKLYKAKGLI